MNKSSLSSAHESNVSRWRTPQLGGAGQEGQPDEVSEQKLQEKTYEDAYNQGYFAGLENAQSKIQQQLDLLNEYILHQVNPFKEINQQISEELANLAGKIARALVKRELKTEPETIMALIRDSIQTLNCDPQTIRIHLHPDDAEILHDINKRLHQKHGWEIIEDPLLGHGDCRVASRDSLIDESLQSRIDHIITQFLGDERNEKTP